MLKGQIIKLIGGIYDVKTNDGTFASRPRGVFRKDGTNPLVGDFVAIEIDENNNSTITQVFDRKNALIRPSLANIDTMVYVVSVIDPVPNYVVTDKFLATMASHKINTVIVITKTDLALSKHIKEIYSTAGYKVFEIDNNTEDGTNDIKKELANKLAVFAGNTGVGKSSLLNNIDRTLNLATGETSQKLGRGKHTTRHVEIFLIGNSINIADTPGFSSMDIIVTTQLLPKDLAECFLEFNVYIPQCKFRDCRHISEIDCGVKTAVEEGLIHISRYESYKSIYNEIKDVKKWHRK